MKPITFLGRSLESIRGFPEGARRAVGFQLDLVQRGIDPDDWKPMATIGRGVREVRVRSVHGAFRVVYIAVYAEAVYVLHAFRKKAQATSRLDVEIARDRYGVLIRSRQQ